MPGTGAQTRETVVGKYNKRWVGGEDILHVGRSFSRGGCCEDIMCKAIAEKMPAASRVKDRGQAFWAEAQSEGRQWARSPEGRAG